MINIYNEKENLNCILENLEDLDFSTRSKRELFNIDVTVYFMDNMDILVSKDSKLEIDYTKNLLQEDLTDLFQKAKEKYQEDYQYLILQKDIYKLTNEYNKNLLNLLPEFHQKTEIDSFSHFITIGISSVALLKRANSIFTIFCFLSGKYKYL